MAAHIVGLVMVPSTAEGLYIHVGSFEASATGTLAVVLLFCMVVLATALRVWLHRVR